MDRVLSASFAMVSLSMIFFHAIQLYNPMLFLSWVKVYCHTFSGISQTELVVCPTFPKWKPGFWGVNECTHLQRSKFSVQGLLGQSAISPEVTPPELFVRFAGCANPFMTGPTVSLILFQGNELGLAERFREGVKLMCSMYELHWVTVYNEKGQNDSMNPTDWSCWWCFASLGASK